jgi:hypothetical protein
MNGGCLASRYVRRLGFISGALMHVKCLDYTVYGPTGWGWKSHKVANPSWEDVEKAIRRLDCFEYPFLHLWTTEDESKHTYDDGGLFEIMGGNGAWWLAGTFDGYFQRRLDYPEQGEAEVAVWTSDQGFADAERHICHDVEVAIRAARYFYDHGDFDPSLKWGSSL